MTNLALKAQTVDSVCYVTRPDLTMGAASNVLYLQAPGPIAPALYDPVTLVRYRLRRLPKTTRTDTLRHVVTYRARQPAFHPLLKMSGPLMKTGK